ncbi:membrane fusion protein, multidrug efflux system [Modicisalibacter ilicicola DSM 19980]|uniref:Membrane fusion protein, multidrug efflux system n=1 Tax=Modicisalibacter ilicicola DSM 19980 TaxID=1121942 RepID=A0A1M4XGA5_9GAMM|nr:efflux RND transporter periplasmic adaptor subunit [Halomonas ilicicola]SHE92544.1 membrane fusion protein, multidrug efflux system [Halomonas ilicicola DSM 19980]
MKSSVRKFRLFIRLIVVLVFLAVVLGGIFGWKYYQMQQMEAQQAQPQPAMPVEVHRIDTESWRTELQSVGTLRAINGIQVANEVPGVVSEIAFESGQDVRQGDILLKLDSSVDQAALEALQAQAQLANETFRRYSDLLPRNAISQSQYDEARADYQAARADVAQQQAQLDKKTIRAPFDGTVGLRQVDLGQYIATGTAIVGLDMLDPIYADYSVPEQRLDQIQPGRQVEVRVSAYPGDVFTGEIIAISPAVNESSRTFDVRSRLDNPDKRLRPGMFADVRTLSPQADEVLTLPRTALSFNTYGDFVFKVVENDDGQTIASRTQVTTGRTRGDQVEITDGLKAGDRVVATGLLRLRDGQTIEPAAANTASEAKDSQEAQG